MEFLLNLTKETLYVIMGITGGAICALHFVSVLAKKTIAKISQYVNIFLHIALFCVLLLSNTAIEVSVAVFMTSAFIYVLVYYLHCKHTEYKKASADRKKTEIL